MKTDETATAEVEIDRASVRPAIRMDDAGVRHVTPILDDVVELFATVGRLEPVHTRRVVEEARLSGTLTDGEYEEFLRWLIHTDLIQEVDEGGDGFGSATPARRARPLEAIAPRSEAGSRSEVDTDSYPTPPIGRRPSGSS